MLRKISILFFILLFKFSNTVFSQSIINYTVADGLPFETIFSCLEDQYGYMWFSSSRGVARYDGEDWMYLSSEDGLSDNDVLNMFEDTNGKIWFITFNGELSYYFNGKVFNSTDHPLFKFNRINNGISSILEDSKQVKWLNPINNNFSSIDEYQFKTYKFQNELQQIRGFIYEIKNEIYLFSRRKLYKLVDDTFIDNSDFLVSKNVRSHHYDRYNNSLIYLTDKGILKINPTGKSEVLIPLAHLPDWKTIGDLFLTKDNRLCVSTINNGVFIYKEYNNSDFSNYHILNDVSISNCEEGQNGNLWFSSINRGVFFVPLNYNPNHLLTKEERLAINKINSFKIDEDGTLWIGSDNGFLYRKKDDTFVKINLNNVFKKSDIVYNQVNDILIEEDKLFIITHNGLLYIPKDNIHQVTLIPNNLGLSYSPKKIFKDSNGIITISHSMGIYQLTFVNHDYKLVKLPYIPHSRNFSHSVAEDGSIWHVNRKWIHRRTKENTENYPLNKYGITQRVSDLELLNDSTVVCTTNGEGVFIISNDKLISKLTKSSGLSSNSPSRIKIIEDQIWICSNNGLDKIVFANNKVDEIINYSQITGFQNNNINDFYVDQDKVLIGNNTNIKILNEDGFSQLFPPPKVYINNATARGVKIPSENVNIKKHNTIIFDCSVVNFNNQNDILYEYKLVGLNNNWEPTRMKYFEFTSLESGSYTFKFRAKRQNSDWSKPAVFAFVIDTPFWAKPFVFIMYVAILIAFILGVILSISKKKHDKKLVEVEQNYQIKSLEQRALQAMMNPHFIFNVLNSIQFYLTSNNSTKAQLNLTRFAKLIRKNLEINQEKFISIEEEIEYLELYLALEKLRFDESFQYKIRVDKLIDETEVNIPTMLIQPFIENAIWHGIMPQGGVGEITIDFKQNVKNLIITVFDNGVGYDITKANKRSTHKSLGLKMTRERLFLMQNIYNQEFSMSLIKVDNKNPSLSGTKVTIKIPLNLF